MSTNTYDKGKRKAQLATALRTLDRQPSIVDEAQKEYARKVHEMQSVEGRRNYSPRYIENYMQQIATERDTAVNKAVEKMAEALGVVKNSQSRDEGISISDTRLQNAVALVTACGGRMDAQDQISILEEFRGDYSALNFLSKIYAANGLYYASRAEQMAKPISSTALDNMETYLAYLIHNPAQDNSGKIMWTRNAFRDYAVQMGLDGDEGDAIRAELVELRNNAETSEQREAFSNGIYEIDKLTQSGETDLATRSAIFDRAVKAACKTNEPSELLTRYEAMTHRVATGQGLTVNAPSAEEKDAALFGVPEQVVDRFDENAVRRAAGLKPTTEV